MSNSIFDTSSSFLPSKSSNSDPDQEYQLNWTIFRNNVFNEYTKKIIDHDPIHYSGIRKHSMYILMLLGKETGINMKNNYLVLKKIRRNPPFIEFSYEFGLSESQVARIFKGNIILISSYIKQFIFWPNKKDI